MIFVFTYNREQMVRELIPHLPTDQSYVILIEDGTAYDTELIRESAMYNDGGHRLRHLQFQHQGKPYFWRLWNYVLQECNNLSHGNFFCFIPDDYTDIDWGRIVDTHHAMIKAHNGTGYVCSVVNDGRGPQWGAPTPGHFNCDLEYIGWQDCGFFCNRAALESIGFYVDPVNIDRFSKPFASSGVGEQLTHRFRKAGVPMLRPYKSFAFHGEHESVMHPEERKRNPLISK